jgi:GR25 family glycosyltransferase involved in LPS biosynthesis
MAAYVPPRRRRSRETFPHNTRENSIDSTIIKNCISSIVCINLKSRPDKWSNFQREVKGTNCSVFAKKVTRFDAIHVDSVEDDDAGQSSWWEDDVRREWDATTNAKYVSKVLPGKRTMSNGEIGCALSHIALWRQLIGMEPYSEGADSPASCMMVLEDDAVFTKKRGKSRFIEAFEEVWKQLPEDWGILYLGFSSRGDRFYLERNSDSRKWKHRVRLYKPTYGFHTHAYVLSKKAANILLQNLPIQGPIDVFLADNDWFGIPVYCAVIEGEGWRNEDGSYEGAVLVSQCRKSVTSDVPQSSENNF